MGLNLNVIISDHLLWHVHYIFCKIVILPESKGRFQRRNWTPQAMLYLKGTRKYNFCSISSDSSAESRSGLFNASVNTSYSLQKDGALCQWTETRAMSLTRCTWVSLPILMLLTFFFFIIFVNPGFIFVLLFFFSSQKHRMKTQRIWASPRQPRCSSTSFSKPKTKVGGGVSVILLWYNEFVMKRWHVTPNFNGASTWPAGVFFCFRNG